MKPNFTVFNVPIWLDSSVCDYKAFKFRLCSRSSIIPHEITVKEFISHQTH